MQDAGAANATAKDAELAGLVGYNLKRVLSIVQADLARVLGEVDLRAVSYSALTVVVRRPGINQTQLAEALRIERSNLVQIIDELAGRNLIQRTAVAGDRRRHALMPTALGAKLQAAAESTVVDHEARLFGFLAELDRVALLRILQAIRSHWND